MVSGNIANNSTIMIHFDKKTLEQWKKDGTQNISIFFYESGCAGTKIKVELEKIPSCNQEIIQGFLCISLKSNEFHLIDEWRITQVGKKWIFTSPKINTRCGCWSSFSLKSESPLQDKIAQMKLAMKQKRDGIHQ
jgi:Fe-S cluster assembly iron-binding protein IscA